jgi:glycosyltransferase involved in cell wall biosynthesis
VEITLALLLSSSMPGIRAIQARNTVLRESILRAERVIALSEFQKKMFVRNHYPADRIEVIAHGLETAGINPLAHPDPDDPLVVGFIASIVPHKGLHILLDALARHPDLELELQIYGALQDETDYGQQILARLKHEPRARRMGTFPPAAIGEILQQIHVLAMPAIWFENEPLVVKAALYAGTPVLASDLGTLSEMIEHNKTGWLIPPASIEAWADALAMLPNSEIAGQGKPLKSMDQNAVEMAVIYDEVLARSGHSDKNHPSG